MRDRMAVDQPRLAHQNEAELQLHQPQAVGPQVHAMHGPNGILSGGPPPAGPPPANMNGVAMLFGPPFETGLRTNGSHSLPFGGTPGPHQLGGVALAQGQQPILNDALSYLDQVKVQFANEPNVYNQFLDIMKDFKSQAIDTPGVIRRVSSLFAGHPSLIQGFNTFLPPGYRIECGTADDPNEIRVTTPMGTQVDPMGASLPPRAPRSESPGGHSHADGRFHDAPNLHWTHAHDFDSAEGAPSPRTANADRSHVSAVQALQSRISDGARERVNDQRSLLHDHGGSDMRPAAMAHAASSRAPLSPGLDAAGYDASAMGLEPGSSQLTAANLDKRGPVEFNHAISYVNKIKNRFAAQPEIYKQFLEILQTYQRESRPIQDVYGQVTHLFNGAPDLLEDFKQFLPESAAHAKAVAAKQAADEATMLSAVRGDGFGNHHRQTPRPEQHRLPPVGNFAPPSAGRDGKRKRADRHGPNASGIAAGPDASNSKNGLGASKRNRQLQQPQVAQSGNTPRLQTQAEVPPLSPSLVPALPEPLAPTVSLSVTTDELAFFDRAKKLIGNKATMNEFLKLCNLYSQDLIDKNMLVYRVQNFIGSSPELMTWFKNFVGYEGKDDIIENKPSAFTGRVTLNNCRGYGPSYRYLPKKDHPATHSVSAAQRFPEPEDKAAWKLPHDFAGQAFAIHKKVVARIYGREKAGQIMDQLIRQPSSVVPVLLARVKTIAEEWKASQVSSNLAICDVC
ncbi:hypothetical protein MRB53_037046 [Persea americana]|nr:hypothetical protein MRB53_037046 [Persea americana]